MLTGAGVHLARFPHIPARLVAAFDRDSRSERRRVDPLKQGSGFRVQGSELRVQGAGCRFQGSGFWAQGSGFRVKDRGFRVQGSGFRAQG